MRDTAESGGAFPESIRKALTKNNSRMYNILIILILISLTSLAGYLVYDILSNRAVGAFDGSSFGLQGKGSIAVIDGWQEKGMKLLEQGKYNESIVCFDKAISDNSTNANAWRYKGNALYALGNYDNSIKCFDKALLLNSSDGEALYNKGRSLFALKRFDDARAAFAKAEKLGKWPNPMRSINSSNTTSVQSGSKTAKGGSRIIVDWARANSEEHSSVDDSSSGDSSYYSAAAPKASTTTEVVSNINSSKAHENNTSNASINATNALMNAANANATTLNTTEISNSLTDNASIDPSIKAAENDGSVKTRVKRASRVPAAGLAGSQEPKAQISATKKSTRTPRTPIASKAKDLGTQVDTSASSSAKVEKTSAVKAALASSKPNAQVSAIKKSIKAPRKPAAPMAPAAKSKTARTPIKK